MSYSGFFSINNSLDDTTKALLKFYLPDGGVIYDPTCGEKNYQFSWLKKSSTIALDYYCNITGRRGKAVLQQQAKEHYRYICSDLKPTGDFIANVSHLPLKNKCADATWYDPPFAPTRDSKDPRAKAFGVNENRTPKQIKEFYSADILKELARVTKKFIFVRGQDIYFPPNTTNFYPFYEMALHSVKKVKELEKKPIAEYTLRYNHGKLPLFRYRLRNVQRPIITYSKIAVLKVKEGAIA
ncbi:hypothetical protein Ngar_c03500 [Candidatus Nitrososphaera gargensis Ga9.2]|uniref:DNA methylase N-4/N-6 domain-containing protein n=1 Tax=Nitrososphaera gargensis (strain Ga9.2) TaxID=1237085 RepID=K0IEQ4_NITGG|nr:hypothetical protein [Candidatus Nitrososphaera gargensis]AFU57268.1 hypothetical protein Ngar_c03200 [Candidatus Nitrososphaera gargensis Ga9.2]AFU57298.1 hypothetical protein Ngar_c03500 [Candidatus Nitrososphaera gargensis Ga9.2]